MADHIPVLKDEVLTYLGPNRGETIVDATLGNAGHAIDIAERIGEKGTLIGIDLDREALQVAEERLAKAPSTIHLVQNNFRDIDKVLSSLNIASVDGILADLGLRSGHIESSGRGFSFMKDEPLQMTFSESMFDPVRTADTIVNEWSEETLTTIFRGFGQERYAKRAAHAIVVEREAKRIETSKELATIIENALPRGRQSIHPATRIFQAIRIAVNDEYGALKEFLDKSFDLLSQGGRLCIISYHSGEDRLVKHFYKERHGAGQGSILTKKPIQPGDEEHAVNPRSRSAKLRVIQKS